MSGTTSIVIAGAGGLGREIAVYAGDAGYRVRGFLDDTDADPSAFGLSIPVLGRIDDYVALPHDAVLVGIGDPAARRAVAERLRARHAVFATLIHPLAYAAQQSSLAEGCIVAPFATIGPNAVLGAHSLINTHAGIGHDARLGAFATISPHAVVNGSARIGTGVLVGSGAVVTPGRSVGDRAKISAGSVIQSDVAADAVLWGNPARALPPSPLPPSSTSPKQA